MRQGVIIVTRGTFLGSLYELSGGGWHSGLELIRDYAGARHFLVARFDQYSDAHMDTIVTSDWPFDLVRSLGTSLITAHSRTSEFRRCLGAFEPTFHDAPEEVVIPAGLSRRVCMIPFNAGEARMLLMLLFDDGLFLSHDRLRDSAVAISYYAAGFPGDCGRSDRSADLTEREVECLSWIGEGKTSDEIALIIGISRNTVNNYITSIMNKTGARTRSEAVAFGVRNQII
ncbi:MAG: helix-turn-helix transcriptional regulator [Hoeflea sp.]|nr:helix-turn-helix transcriptional regulator [Hoeflea sp.]|tara:strand:+ start:1023 stop:1709 length:687 start_codon:yes stop_codon:yes gene_type:complete